MFDDENEVDLPEAEAPLTEAEAEVVVSTEDNDVIVATRRGYEFVSSIEGAPKVDAEGVKVKRSLAEQIVAQSNGRVSIIDEAPASDEDKE